MIERIFGERRVSSRDISEASLEVILERFVGEGEREKRVIESEQAIERSVLAYALFRENSFPFCRKVLPPGIADKEKGRLGTCDNYGLIFFGALLTGRTNPGDKQKLDEILCGEIIEKEDSIGIFGPLSGRKGENLVPFSQCWLVTTELQRLVRFMRKPVEELPGLEQSFSLPEDEQVALLLKRKEVRRKMEQKGDVIVTWKEIIGKFYEAAEGEVLLLTSGKGNTDEKGLKPFVFDPSLQFDIGGEEYMRLVEWVKDRVLKPLVKLVGEKNFLETEDGKFQLWLSFKKTSDNCPKAPKEAFFGPMS